jgi:hypothetical protein
MCRECQQCQRGKVHKQPAAPVQAIPVPARKFSHVHVDLVGPLPASSDGHVYLLTIIDRSTRWFEAVPLRNMEASTCVEAFIANWVARFGVPETVTTDRGTLFTSALWSSACTSLGIKHVLTTAYHPQSNGMVERVHRQLKDALRAHGAGPAWHSHLPWVLLGLRAAPKEDSAVSSAELITGTRTARTTPARARSSTCGRAATSYEASFLCGSGQHTAGSFSQGGARVCACWRPAEAVGGPICRPLIGGLQGSQDLHHPGGPAAGDRVGGSLEASHRPGSSISC